MAIGRLPNRGQYSQVMVVVVSLLLGGCATPAPPIAPDVPVSQSTPASGLFKAADGAPQQLTVQALQALGYSGAGSFRWPDGRYYSGAWENSQPHGQGDWHSPDGARYSGGWRTGQYHGTGDLRDANGARYQGSFVAGKRQGQGVQKNSDGEYRGNWEADQPQGQGTFSGADGSVYVGAYQSGDRHGAGRFTSATGSVYDGDWLLDEASGFGVLVEADGGRREGQWLDGVSHGYGSYEHPAGLRYEGNWEADQRAGFGAEQRPDGSSFEGSWVADQRHGQGTLTLANGSAYSGSWRHGKRHGEGTASHPSGYRLEGTWNDGQLTGGTLSLPTPGSNGSHHAQPMVDSQGRWLPPTEQWLRDHAAIGNITAAWLLIERGATDAPMPLLRLAAEGGIALAQYELGKRLLDTDLRGAVDWLNKAANGTPHCGGAAHFLLGSLYHFGDLLAQDQDQAESHYLAAIERGSIMARRNLAAMLATTSINYLRDPARALGLIEPIALLYQSPGLLDALAVVYFANHRAADAAGAQQAALAALLRESEAGSDDPAMQTQAHQAMQARLLEYRRAAQSNP